MTISKVLGNNGYLEIYNEKGLSGKIFIGREKSMEQYSGVAVKVCDMKARTYYYYDENAILIKTDTF